MTQNTLLISSWQPSSFDPHNCKCAHALVGLELGIVCDRNKQVPGPRRRASRRTYFLLIQGHAADYIDHILDGTEVSIRSLDMETFK